MSRSLTSGDLGSYAYGGGSNHVHAVTRITAGGAAYTATYDLAGNEDRYEEPAHPEREE